MKKITILSTLAAVAIAAFAGTASANSIGAYPSSSPYATMSQQQLAQKRQEASEARAKTAELFAKQQAEYQATDRYKRLQAALANLEAQRLEAIKRSEAAETQRIAALREKRRAAARTRTHYTYRQVYHFHFRYGR